jgi:hypothetical protein
MVDDDVCPTQGATGLLNALQDYFIVGAACPIFRPDMFPIPIWNAFNAADGGWKLVRPPAEDAVVEVDAVGFGCVAIRREVLEELPQPTFRDVAVGGAGWGEDFLFCQDAREAGFTVACDYAVRPDHLTRVSLGAAKIQHPQVVLQRPKADMFGMVTAP